MENYTNALPIGSRLKGNSMLYEIIEVLGQGGFGITYKAELLFEGKLGISRSGAFFAIKEFFLSEHNVRKGQTVTGTEGKTFQNNLRKFERESRLLSGICHPGICHVQDAFSANGTAYYVMDFYPGGSMSSLVSHAPGGALSEERALGYMREIGSALAYLHRRSMAHLDLKPQNIMLKADGHPLLIDFGISKQFDDDGQFRSSDTMGGCTPGYAPIEQANYTKGDGDPHLMDIYALGATLYKMLTGQTPPKASEVFNSGLPTDLLREKGVSDATIGVIVKAMQPRKTDRYRSVEAMMAALPGSDEVGEVTVVDVKTVQQQREEEQRQAELNKTYGHTYPSNFDLCTTMNGKVFYFTQSEWNSVPSSVKSQYSKKGVYVSGNGLKFLVALHDSGNKKYKYTWDVAMSLYRGSLPTLGQAKVMANNHKAINSAIIAFGGDKDPDWWYWTRTEYDSSNAWVVRMYNGGVGYTSKTHTTRFRAVAPVPSSAR